MINSMSFGCRHMKEFNKNGVFCLSAHTPEGYVKVMRVGDVDYIWTEGGVSSLLYIILIPDTIKGYRIPVTIKGGDYTFGPIESFGLKPSISRYQFMPDVGGITGASPRQQYMPYIFKYLGQSHASVGDPGGEIFFSPQDEWHYKFYVLDCTGEASSKEKLWRPPGHGSGWAFGQDLLPPWYSMSPFTAHAFHWCFEAAIDQLKKTYIPYNTEVTLAAEGIVIPNFDILDSSGKKYNMQYPLLTNKFYGKNAYTYTTDLSGNKEISSIGEHIYISGVVTPTIPETIDPIFYFWPWIPYLDEIRAFNLMFYSQQYEMGDFAGWFMTPGLDTFHKLSIGYFTPDGVFATQSLSEDEASFSPMAGTESTNNVDGPAECGCGLCGTGTWTINEEYATAEYTSSGTKNIPLGLIGGKIPIIMKTVWSQTGTGPSGSSSNVATISGNYPWKSINSGEGQGLVFWYEQCCAAFANTHVRALNGNESASNQISITQELKVGDDVIFSGESSMDYSMNYSFQEDYNASIQATVTPPSYDPPVCAGHINYTSQAMGVGATQDLSWTDETIYITPPCQDPPDEFTFTWSLSGGGSLSSTTDQNIVYTAPASNPNCGSNATISLLCNGTVIDTLEITIMGTVGGTAYYATVCSSEGHCYEPRWTGSYWVTEFTVASVQIWYYGCTGTGYRTGTSCAAGSGSCIDPDNPVPCADCLASKTVSSYCSAEYTQTNRLSCGGAALDCTAWCVVDASLSDGPALGEPVDVRTPAMIAKGCCPPALM